MALRDAAGGYLGCLEVTQDLTEKRALAGEQRLLFLDLARAKGFESYSAAGGEGLVRTWFRRAGGPAG